MAENPLVNRIKSCLFFYSINDYEHAFINLFIAIDITAKKRYPNLKVGERNRKLLMDIESLTQKLTFGNVVKGLNVGGLTFPKVFYKFGRNALIHEGQLDPKLTISDIEGIRISNQSWDFHHSYIINLALSVIACHENKDLRFNHYVEINNIHGIHDVNTLWGKEELMRKQLGIEERF